MQVFKVICSWSDINKGGLSAPDAAAGSSIKPLPGSKRALSYAPPVPRVPVLQGDNEHKWKQAQKHKKGVAVT